MCVRILNTALSIVSHFSQYKTSYYVDNMNVVQLLCAERAICTSSMYSKAVLTVACVHTVQQGVCVSR